MLAANVTVRKIKSASRKKQYGVIARENVSNGCMAVGAKRSDLNVIRRGFSRNARMWHCFTKGGEPVCDVCKRVGHVARNCWLKKKSSERFKGRGTIVHSVVKNQEGCTVVERHVAVSVGGRQLEALLDCNAMENAVNFEIVKVDPKLKMYDFQDRDGASSKWKSDARGMVWLPVVIGSRSEKLRCVVVKDLKEKLVIGLPGLSFLGASINFATGDLHVDRRRRKKVEGDTMARRKDELHEDCTLVREAKTKCTKSVDTSRSRVVSSKKSPEGGVSKKECIRTGSLEQVKDLAVKENEHVNERGKDKCKKPNQKVTLVSGRGRKEGKVNVVSPKKDEKLITPDHDDDEESESDDDSGSEDKREREEPEKSKCGNAKANKGKCRSKHKKNKKRKGRRQRR